MRLLLFSSFFVGLMSAPVVGAQAEAAPPAEVPTAEAAVSEKAPEQEADGKPENDASDNLPIGPVPETKPIETVPAPAPVPEVVVVPVPTIKSEEAPVAPTVVAPPVAQSGVRAPAEPAAFLSVMEQLLIAQHDREVSLYRETIRLVMTFGIAFAVLCMVGLLAAAVLNYRALLAVQHALLRPAAAVELAAPPKGDFLPAAPAGAVPGMERIQASGQRFQSRMSSLEERLAELEHLAARKGPVGVEDERPLPEAENSAHGLAGLTALEEEAPPAARRVIPRAMILVHKAQTQMNLGKLAEALTTLDEAASLDFARPEIHLTRGQVLEKMGRLADALQAYESAVQSDEANTNALLMKAGVLNRQERFSEALACYERALEVHRTQV